LGAGGLNREVLQYEFIHYESFRDYISDTTKKNKAIVFLDYFLDKDKKTSINFINQIEAEILVGFSSWLEFSDVIKKKATESHRFAEVYSVQKIKETLENHQLGELLHKILIAFTVMKLQDIVSQIHIPLTKITGYALKLNHPNGGDKAYMFKKHLGYTQDNYAFLLTQIEEMVLTTDAIAQRAFGSERPSNEHGRIFQVDLQILGNYQGQKETVRTGWIVKRNSNIAQLTTLYIIER
jgi:hypothetical protein